jgi:protoheme ferro-lyase
MLSIQGELETRNMAKSANSEADKAVWFTICVQFTADTLGLSVKEVARMLNKHGMVDWLLSGYGSFHTQGYEYMSELISDKLRQVHEVS